MEKCCVIIPIYKEYDRLSSFEKKSINNVIMKMSNWDIYIICPKEINVDTYKKVGIVNFIYFDKSFFRSVNAYNELMLSPFFYETFSDYEYMLIAQTDSYIFEDKLQYFIDCGYDYIGGLHYINEGTNVYHPNVDKKMINGNGGFSLRKTDAFIKASQNIKKDLNNKWDWEDVLYSYWYKDHMNIAPDNIALKFAWQQDPQLNYEKNNKELPFGCHKPHIFGKNFEGYKIIFE